jgi:hypothetical protein
MRHTIRACANHLLGVTLIFLFLLLHLIFCCCCCCPFWMVRIWFEFVCPTFWFGTSVTKPLSTKCVKLFTRSQNRSYQWPYLIFISKGALFSSIHFTKIDYSSFNHLLVITMFSKVITLNNFGKKGHKRQYNVVGVLWE